MNIFVLDKDPVVAAQMACDKHVVKMILESAQLLCSAFEPNTAPYKRTHYNHPCSIWIRESKANYEWVLRYAYALVDEYNYRYNPKKDHASLKVINWCKINANNLKFPNNETTNFALVVPEEYRLGDIVESYRSYYRKDKATFAKWTKRDTPSWFY